MSRKSQVAFLLSAQKFFDWTEDRAYFWTFTFKKTMPDWWYPRSWNAFMAAMQTQYGGFLQGLRVVEVHPGGHGLHYHALFNQRISWHVIERVGARYGLGKPWVEKVESPYKGEGEQHDRGAALYLAKYLAKRSPLHPGMRRWATVGGFKQVRVNDIECDSVFHRNYKMIAGGRKLPIQDVSYIYSVSMLWGDLVNWPQEYVENYKKRLTNSGNHDLIIGNERKDASDIRSYTV